MLLLGTGHCFRQAMRSRSAPKAARLTSTAEVVRSSFEAKSWSPGCQLGGWLRARRRVIEPIRPSPATIIKAQVDGSGMPRYRL